MAEKSRSLTVMITVVILSLQSVGLLAIAALFSYETATSPSLSLGGSIFFDVLVWVSALAAGAATRAFWNGRSGVRGAIIVWQMLLVGVAIASGQGADGRIDLALLLGIPAVLVTVGILFDKGIAAHLATK